MNKRLLIGFLTCFLLSGFANTARADPCPPPSCPACYTWNGSACVWACGAGSCCGGSCCSNTCCNGVCCAAGQICCNGTCCSPNRCCNGVCCGAGTCCADSDCGNPSCWICIKCQCHFLCNTANCEECISGTCTDKCPLLGQCKKCDGSGNCVTKCHPELCEQCVNNECKVCGGDPYQCCISGNCKYCWKLEALDPIITDSGCYCDYFGTENCTGLKTQIQLHTPVGSSCSSSGYTEYAWFGGQHIGYYWECMGIPDYLGIIDCWLLHNIVCGFVCAVALDACLTGSPACYDCAIACNECLINEDIDCGCLVVICIYPGNPTGEITGSDIGLLGPCGL